MVHCPLISDASVLMPISDSGPYSFNSVERVFPLLLRFLNHVLVWANSLHIALFLWVIRCGLLCTIDRSWLGYSPANCKSFETGEFKRARKLSKSRWSCSLHRTSLLLLAPCTSKSNCPAQSCRLQVLACIPVHPSILNSPRWLPTTAPAFLRSKSEGLVI